MPGVRSQRLGLWGACCLSHTTPHLYLLTKEVQQSILYQNQKQTPQKGEDIFDPDSP